MASTGRPFHVECFYFSRFADQLNPSPGQGWPALPSSHCAFVPPCAPQRLSLLSCLSPLGKQDQGILGLVLHGE